MKIHTYPQRSTEWFQLRALNFTASELGEWILDPVKITLTVDQLKDELDRIGIARKGVTKRDDLISLLSDPNKYMTLCDGARTAIIGKIKQERLLKMRQRDYDSLTMEEQIFLDRENEMQAASDRAFEYNIPVKYGNLLEPFARSAYESLTGYEVAEVGFIEADGFGCSPDGLIPYMDDYSHGIEIKCAVPTTHIAWLLDGKLPDCHSLQVHASLAVSGLDRWDFFAYCPGELPLHIIVNRDETTERVLRGLKILVSEKAKMKRKLAGMWEMNASVEQPPDSDTPPTRTAI